MEKNRTPTGTHLVPSINYHLWQPCNMQCGYCFAVFDDVRSSVLPRGHLGREDALRLTEILSRSCDKLTFVGGEPTLCPWLGDLIRRAKELGVVTMLVTNGSRLDAQRIDALAPILDWLTLSIDSPRPESHAAVGRAVRGRPIATERYLDIAAAARARGVRLKLNTVVTRVNVGDDLRPLVEAMRPERWKIFQALPVRGQNDEHIADLTVDGSTFAAFVARHRVVEESGVEVVAEENEDMKGTYAMVDPAGRFFDNEDCAYRYGPAILEVGVEAAWSAVRFDRARFEKRGGLYQFRLPGAV